MTQEAVHEQVGFWRPSPGRFPANAWFGMPTRRGGVSRGPYASLNLGQAVGDDPDHVLRNRAIVFQALGIPEPGPVRVRQVHGTRIVTPGEAPADADGLLVRPGDPWVAISAADCAPVALVARDGSHAALLHSGWRGAQGKIAAAGVRLLAQRGVPASEIVASIGPCIHACCYPVGPEVAREFSKEVAWIWTIWIPSAGLFALMFWRQVKTIAPVLGREMAMLIRPEQIGKLRANQEKLKRELARLAAEYARHTT